MNRLRPWLYLAPALLVVGAWIYLPALATLALSLTRWNLTGSDARFVGLDNYTELLTGPEIAGAAVNTAAYVVGLVPFVVLAPLAVAILLWKHDGRAARIYRAALFVPVIVAPAVVAVMWQWLLHPVQGLLTQVVAALGGGRVDWLGEQTTALWAVVVITGWKLFGLSVILFTAGLMSIDSRHVEAARVDGATEWEVTRRVVLPLLVPTTTFVTFLCLVLAGQWSFATISVLTRGGPAGSTDNLYYLLYRYAFDYFDTGVASALAVVLLAVFGALALVQLRVSDRFAHQQR